MKVLLKVWDGFQYAIEMDHCDLQVRILLETRDGQPVVVRRQVATFQQTGECIENVPVFVLRELQPLDAAMLSTVRP